MSVDTNISLDFRRLRRAAVPVSALLLFGGLLWHKMADLDVAALGAAFQTLSVWNILLSGLFTALSLRAVGQYDALLHRVLRTGVPYARARRAGTRAIALSQAIGLGTLTGALVRWRLLGEMSLGAATRLSVMVSLSFLGAMGIVLALVLPVSGLAHSQAGWAVPIGLALAAGLAGLATQAHRFGWLPERVSLGLLARLVFAALLDTGAAAAALWVLWPDDLGFGVIFGVYLIALSAGLLSNAPAGLGAFDLTVLALLPTTPEPAAVAALLAFRAIYYAAPACLAVLTLIRPRAATPLRPLDPVAHPNDPPEAALALQGAGLLGNTRRYLALRSPGVLAIKGAAPALSDLRQRAREEGRRPALYQCSKPDARRARRKRWAVLRLAREAIVPLADWSIEGPQKRQLRRKLRNAEKAGLSIRSTRTMAELAPVARAWAQEHGGEQGLSMGRFDAVLLTRQKVFAAYQNGAPVAFVTFHCDGPRWTLDLMRHITPCPPGAMHALVIHAIMVARASGASQLSLAAVPALPPHLPFAARINRQSRGLAQFKDSFAPHWQPRYLAAPTHGDLLLALVSLGWAIHHPPALAAMRHTHNEYAAFSIATPTSSCDAQPNENSPSGTLAHVHKRIKSYS